MESLRLGYSAFNADFIMRECLKVLGTEIYHT
ncbi:hypothetical protein T190_29730 [Sinorhizobium meliloti CCBAU 01290]|nr:hypothetical protein T190_29730 [Sinorhizobium meliloti CCBAU 01290]